MHTRDQTALPLVVDLDGTLLRSDLLVETALQFVRDQPLRAGSLLTWLLRGKAALKHELATATALDVSVLPYDPAVLAYAARAREAGRPVVLATASHTQLADQVSTHLGLFDDVLATDQAVNLAGRIKRDQLVDRYGVGGFDYLGNSAQDLPVWEAARHAIVVNAPAGVERRARSRGNVTETLRADRATGRAWIRALRLHQWLKNVLLFVPLLGAHQAGNAALLWSAVIGFVAFGLCASSVYLLNDMVDLSDDRHHPRKRERPFASGQLPVTSGVVAVPLLLLLAFGLSLLTLPMAFSVCLAGYYILTMAYSFVLKRFMVVDVVTLAGLYTMRIIAGGVGLGVPLTFWLLAFSMFLFLSLALGKRFAEMHQLKLANREWARGRGYRASDLPMLASLGASSGYVSVMILALYVNDPRTAQLYTRPEAIWLACPILLTWVSRVWMYAHRGALHEDPVLFALTDRPSLLLGAALAAVVAVAST